MAKEYDFDGTSLRIVDPELGIAIQERFEPRKLPPFHQLDNDPDVAIDRSGGDEEISAGFRSEKGLEGEWKCFTPAGQIKGECTYREGVLHGPSRLYHKNGQCLSESWFYCGLQHGQTARYNRRGALLAVERYVAGKREGSQVYYYPDGTLKTTLEYKEGKLEGAAHLFWADGTQKRSASFQNGQREGWDRIWGQAGALLSEGEYKEGNPVGRHRCWHDNGTLLSMRSYHTPETFDEWEWDEEGQPLCAITFDATHRVVEKRWEEGKERVRHGKWVAGKVEWDERAQ